jgi:hypothetical protein
MTSENQSLANLDNVVHETLAYFEGLGRATQARIDKWEARDVLMHFIYFHEATAWGIRSVALGGPLWTVPTEWDTVNEVSRLLHEGESLDEVLAQVRQAHGRLQRAIADATDLDQPVLRRPDGKVVTGRERIEAITDHWLEHLHELEALETQ